MQGESEGGDEEVSLRDEEAPGMGEENAIFRAKK